MKDTRGFTMIEMMIVVTIIMIILAVAIPNMLRSRMQSNESATVGNLRTVMASQAAFHASRFRYANDFEELQSGTPPYINGNWLGPRSGYELELTGGSGNFRLTAEPETLEVTGTRGFYTDASGVIRQEPGGGADENSAPIGH